MKRKALALILLSALIISMNFGIYFVYEAACRGTLIVTVDSPQNKVYTSYNVVVSISASDPDLLTGPESVAYSLDGEPEVIIATAPLGMHSLNGSTVLSLSNGRHEIVGVGITWFNGTADGIFYSKPVYFTVDSPTNYVSTPTPVASPSTSPSPEPTPTPPEGSPYSIPACAIGSVIAVAVVGLGLLVFFKKRKH